MDAIRPDHDTPTEDSPGKPTDRRTFVKGTAMAGAGLVSLGGPAAAAAQQSVEDPQRPSGLGPNGMLDQRFPVTYERSVPEGVRVLTQFFAALARRDLEGVAELLHYPFGSFEGVEPVVVANIDDMLRRPLASINMSDDPRRFSQDDGYMKPGCYDTLVGLEVLNFDPTLAAMSLVYDRWDDRGKQLLRCEGIYTVTNNDGKWGLQLMSTIFTPADMIGVSYPDTVEIAQRLRVWHTMSYQMSDRRIGAQAPQLGTSLGISRAPGTSQPWSAGPEGDVMALYQIRDIQNRLNVGETTQADLDARQPSDDPAADYAEYRALFPMSGVGEWGWLMGKPARTRVLHHNFHKAHVYQGAERYTVAGEKASQNHDLRVITYREGRWGRAGSLAYTTPHDRSNDVRPGPGGAGPQGIG